jgi:hypothetical protein
MGSWNATCSITKLPITEGEEIVLFITISQMRDYLNFGNVDPELFHPLTGPFYGTYNDYGSIALNPDYKEYHDAIFAAVMSHISGDLAETPKDVPQSIEDLLLLIVRSHAHGPMKTQLNTVMMHAHPWKVMVDDQADTEYRWWSHIDPENPTRPGPYNEPAEYTYKTYYEALLDFQREKITEISQDPELGKSAFDDMKIYHALSNLFRTGGVAVTPIFHEMLNQSIPAPYIRPELVNFLLTKELASLGLFTWIPVSHQHDDYYQKYMKVLGLISDIVATKNKYGGDLDDDYFDEDEL